MILELHNISFQYTNAESEVLKKISFSIQKGSIMALTGESGAGKTTLLKIIAGIETPSVGKIFWKQKKIISAQSQLVHENKQIKLLDQNLTLQPHISLLQNLEYSIRSFPYAAKKKRIEELIDIFQISEIIHKYPNEISGGQKQRIVFAITIAPYPQLLLLDEPFAHLDPLLKKKLFPILKHIFYTQKITVILATHHIADIFFFSDKLLLLKNGEIEMFQNTESLTKNTLSDYVSSFFGTPN
ncbi:MAG: ATP-binding cassette domain-containing protein [Chitinophagaceae bacterium]|nr:ATP-binding cassette domain-containing protein [Chitinophagaceae bacterium]